MSQPHRHVGLVPRSGHQGHARRTRAAEVEFPGQSPFQISGLRLESERDSSPSGTSLMNARSWT